MSRLSSPESPPWQHRLLTQYPYYTILNPIFPARHPPLAHPCQIENMTHTVRMRVRILVFHLELHAASSNAIPMTPSTISMYAAFPFPLPSIHSKRNE